VSKPRVWIVDDSPLEREITIRAISSLYACEQLGDGSELVERLAHDGPRPDLILLDWMMPGMRGDEACRYIQSRADLRQIPIIFVTATRVATDDVVKGLALGAKDHIARPFAPEELRARIEGVLRGKLEGDAASRERVRLAAINGLSRALFGANAVNQILDQLVRHLTATLCDGCSVTLLPGVHPAVSAARHRSESSDGAVATIGSIADPGVHVFADNERALEVLPAAYHDYVRRFGLRGLAILPFPGGGQVEGVVTVTRDRGSEPFAPEDLAAIETCIEYAGLAVQNVRRFEAEQGARAQLSAIIDHAPIGIVVADRAGNILLTNPAVRALLPRITTSPDLGGVFELDAWSFPDGRPIDRAQWPLGQFDRSGTAHCTLVADGVRRLAVTTVALGDPGAPSGSISTLDDVTAAHDLVAERERVALFQERMLGIVGHDLRSPLSAMNTGFELLDQHAIEVPALARILPRLHTSSRRMTRIINLLLDVTRARLGGGIPIQRRRVDLGELVRSIVDEQGLAYPSTAFELSANGPVEGIWDPDRLEQVIANLLGNAAQYGRPGSPVTLAVSATASTATITVHNTIRTEPIATDLLETLFDPFRRGREQAAHARGLGLGLYIVSEIVRAHGGTITATSAASGTDFVVVLPRDSRE